MRFGLLFLSFGLSALNVRLKFLQFRLTTLLVRLKLLCFSLEPLRFGLQKQFLVTRFAGPQCSFGGALRGDVDAGRDKKFWQAIRGGQDRV